MTNNGIVNIKGKPYMTVAGRLEEAQSALKSISITTELVPHVELIIVKATVVTPKGTFTGHSAANPAKLIEKQSPVEVAETSAVGRALGFAGYGVIDGIATADEIVKAEPSKDIEDDNDLNCAICDTTLSPAIISFCLNNQGRFKGKVFCMQHQNDFPSAMEQYAKGGTS